MPYKARAKTNSIPSFVCACNSQGLHSIAFHTTSHGISSVWSVSYARKNKHSISAMSCLNASSSDLTSCLNCLCVSFFAFLTEPCLYCVTRVTVLEILKNHCPRYIFIFEQRLVIFYAWELCWREFPKFLDLVFGSVWHSSYILLNWVRYLFQSSSTDPENVSCLV